MGFYGGVIFPGNFDLTITHCRDLHRIGRGHARVGVANRSGSRINHHAWQAILPRNLEISEIRESRRDKTRQINAACLGWAVCYRSGIDRAVAEFVIFVVSLNPQFQFAASLGEIGFGLFAHIHISLVFAPGQFHFKLNILGSDSSAVNIGIGQNHFRNIRQRLDFGSRTQYGSKCGAVLPVVYRAGIHGSAFDGNRCGWVGRGGSVALLDALLPT